VRPEKAQRFVIRVVVLGGAAALIGAWAAAPPELDASTIRRALVLLAISTAAELVSIRLARGETSEQITLGEVAIAADVALLPAALSPIVAVAALTLSLIIRRRPLVKTAYNAAQYALATMAAATCFHGLGGGDIETSAGLFALFAGMAAFGASNLLTISVIISTTTGRALRDVLRSEIALSLAIALGSSSIGIVAVALWLERPVLVGAILAPVSPTEVGYGSASSSSRSRIRRRSWNGSSTTRARGSRSSTARERSCSGARRCNASPGWPPMKPKESRSASCSAVARPTARASSPKWAARTR
jgi:hypothetical protein